MCLGNRTSETPHDYCLWLNKFLAFIKLSAEDAKRPRIGDLKSARKSYLIVTVLVIGYVAALFPALSVTYSLTVYVPAGTMDPELVFPFQVTLRGPLDWEALFTRVAISESSPLCTLTVTWQFSDRV